MDGPAVGVSLEPSLADGGRAKVDEVEVVGGAVGAMVAEVGAMFGLIVALIDPFEPWCECLCRGL